MAEQLQFGETMFDRWRELDGRVVAALSSALLDEREKEILRVIAGHKGAAKAIRSEDVAAAAGMEWSEKTRREDPRVGGTAGLLLKIPNRRTPAKTRGRLLNAQAQPPA